LGFSFRELIPTGYVIYFFMASSNTTFGYNSSCQGAEKAAPVLAQTFCFDLIKPEL
jgi:hypothetical protein